MVSLTVKIADEFGNEYEATFPGQWVICSMCEGEGSHSNPSIDGHGISQQEWAEEWDEESRANYINGVYDIRCEQCNGSGKVVVVNVDYLNDDQHEVYKRYQDHLEELEILRMEEAAERRWGC